MQGLRTRRGVIVAGVVLVAVLAVLVPGAVGAATSDPATDNTVTHIDVRADGSAHWTVRIRTHLPTEESVTRYEAFQERFRENRSRYLAGFRDPMESIVAAAADATGREMRATNFSAETSIRSVPRRWGIVSYEFTWEGFARTEGDTLHVGDAFESGFFITANDTLRLEAPDGYELSAVAPTPDEREDGTAVWHGRVDFGDGNPSATMTPAATQPAGGLPLPLLLGLLAVLLLVGAVGYRRFGGEDASTGDAGRGGTTTASAPTTSAPPPVTDEERLLELLRDHGGRMRQADIVAEVEWSKSKVSRLLDDLVEEGVVEKTRLGRENVVSLVEDDGNGPGE